jgi:hypothetical protein
VAARVISPFCHFQASMKYATLLRLWQERQFVMMDFT